MIRAVRAVFQEDLREDLAVRPNATPPPAAAPTSSTPSPSPAPAERTAEASVSSQAREAVEVLNEVRPASAQLGQEWRGALTSERAEEPASPPATPQAAPPPPPPLPPPASPTSQPTGEQSTPSTPSGDFGLQGRDAELRARSDFSDIQTRFQSFRDSTPGQVYTQEGESGTSSYEVAASDAERDAFAANFVDSQTGVTGAEILHLQGSIQAYKDQQLVRERPPSQNYGLSQRDQQVQAHANLATVQSAFNEMRAAAPQVTETMESEAGTQSWERPPSEAERDQFAASFLDAGSGISGSDLIHLRDSQAEKRQGDLAMNKLETLKVGSFSNNQMVQSLDADRVFTVVGRDQREALMADGATPVGKAFALKDGRLLLQDEDETGVWFVSSVSGEALKATGVIDTNNGGMNIDGLYLHDNAYIGTSRPKGGLFGNILNAVSGLLPGGKLGDLLGDAISDTNKFLNLPAKEFAKAVGSDNGFLSQVVGHQEATVEVLSHSGQTGDHTYDELVKQTAQFDKVDRVANQVGQALVSTGIPIVSWIGAGITVVSGSMMAGHAQLAGDNEADPNQGFIQAAQAYALSQAGSAVGSAAGSSAAEFAQSAGFGEYASQFSTFTSNVASTATRQVLTTGEVNLGDALQAGVLGVAGAATQIGDTGVSAVQVGQLGVALAEGNVESASSTLTGMITGAVRSRGQTEGAAPATSGTPANQASEGETAPVLNEGTSTSPTISAAVNLSDAEVEEILRTADTGRSASGPRLDVFPNANGDLIVMTTDSDGRAQMTSRVDGETGNQRVLQPDGSWATFSPDNRPLSLERTDSKGSTIMTQFGEDGKATSQRTILTNGVILDTKADSSMLTVKADAFGPAFAAARAAGVGVFSWNGQMFHTGTADQVNSIVDQFMDRNASVLSNLSPEVRASVLSQATQATTNAFSQRALDIANHNSDNTAGLDSRTLQTGLGAALDNGQQLQATLNAQTTPSPTASAPGATSLQEALQTAERAKAGDPEAVVQNTRNIMELTREPFRQEFVAKFRQENGGLDPTEAQIQRAHNDSFLKAFVDARYGFGAVSGINPDQIPQAFRGQVANLLESFPNAMTAGAPGREVAAISVNHLLSGVQWNTTSADGVSEFLAKYSVGWGVNSHLAEAGKGVGLFPGHSGEEPGHSGIYAADSRTLQRMFSTDPVAAMQAFITDPQTYIREGTGVQQLASMPLARAIGSVVNPILDPSPAPRP